MTDPSDDALIHDMTRHPGFVVLKQRFEDSRKKKLDSLATYLLANVGPVDQVKLDRSREFIRGGEWFFKQCRSAKPGVLPDDEDGDG